jgi:hypothetical protein
MLMQIISRIIATDQGEDTFNIRIKKQEGVGLLITSTGKNYLILDSFDFWYDVIQDRYPRNIKCSCKNEWFKVRFDYIIRKGTHDVKYVNVYSTCIACLKEKKQMSVEIKYGPTDHLIDNPLTFCEQPNLKYDSRMIQGYWKYNDLKKLLAFVSNDLQADIYCWFWQRSDDKRHFEKVSLEKAMMITTVNHQYFSFYFSKLSPAFSTIKSEKGDIYVEEDHWRRQELIELDSPQVVLSGTGNKALLFCLSFSSQYIDRGVVKNKSPEFLKLTEKLLGWLNENFSVGAANVFNNPEEIKRMFDQ